MKIQDKLKTIEDFQKKYPESHVGGSVGLFLHGVNLFRDLTKSDIDITNPDKIGSILFETYEESSNTSDFDYSVLTHVSDSVYHKIEIRVNPEPSFVVIGFDGINYNVSKLKDIMFWKQKYADKGYRKHIEDLEAIKNGFRPEAMVNISHEDDLPF